MGDKTEMTSAFADGELSEAESSHLLTELYSDQQLRERWQRYHLIGDALRKNLPPTIQTDLAERVSKSLEGEVTILAPKAVTTNKSLTTPRKYKMGFAIAASVAMMGFAAFFTVNNQQSMQPQIASTVGDSALKVATSQYAPLQVTPHVVLTADSNQALVVDRLETSNPKLKSYLLEHEYSTASAVRRGLPPGMRMVTFTSGH